MSTVTVDAEGLALIGDLSLPQTGGASGVVVFAHGSGSSRTSPRNRAVAEALQREGFATLLFDLLTREEEIEERFTGYLRFNIPLLAERLIGAVAWARQRPGLSGLPVALFGASTGAAAALIAATRADVATVVSRGGRPDLAGPALPSVRCPTLLIVGGADVDVIALNQRAMRQMTAPVKMHIVPRAGHLFEEPGALRSVIDVAAAWLHEHLGARAGIEQHAPR